MGYALQVDADLAGGLRRIACEQAAQAIADLQAALAYDGPAINDGEEDVWDEGVHEARKAGKKIRAVARLCRDALGDDYARINQQFRDASRLLSDVRDGCALVGTAAALDESLLPVDTREELRRTLFERYVNKRDYARATQLLPQALQAFRDAAADIPQWPLPVDLAPAELAPSIGRVYRRGQQGWHYAQDTAGDYTDAATEQWHDWRKRVKYLRYHADLLSPAQPQALSALEEELHRLSDALGDDHDLAVLLQTVRAERLLGPEATERLAASVATRQGKLRGEALQIAAPLYRESPTVFIRRMVDARRLGRSGLRLVSSVKEVGRAGVGFALSLGVSVFRRLFRG